MPISIKFTPTSILAFLTAISAIAVFIAIMFQENSPIISQQLLGVFQPVFSLCIAIWLIYVGLSIFRNIKRL